MSFCIHVGGATYIRQRFLNSLFFNDCTENSNKCKSLLDNNNSKTKVFTVVLKTENLSSYVKIIFEQELRLRKKTFPFFNIWWWYKRDFLWYNFRLIRFKPHIDKVYRIQSKSKWMVVLRKIAATDFWKIRN